MARGTDTHDRIVAISRQLFAEKGYAATTTAEIARLAGIAEGTIYRHFADKNELFLACVTPVIDESLARGLAEIAPSADLRTVVRAALEYRLRMLEQNMDGLKILFTQAAFHPELANLFVDRVVLGRPKHVAPLFDQLYARGELKRPPNHLLLGLGILGAIWTILTARTMLAARGDALPAPFETDRLLDDLTDLILYGIAGE